MPTKPSATTPSSQPKTGRKSLLPAIADIAALDGAAIIEFGAGTGRLTRQLLPYVRSLRAFDFSPHMLQIAPAPPVRDAANDLVADGR